MTQPIGEPTEFDQRRQSLGRVSLAPLPFRMDLSVAKPTPLSGGRPLFKSDGDNAPFGLCRCELKQPQPARFLSRSFAFLWETSLLRIPLENVGHR